jgi:PKD domain
VVPDAWSAVLVGQPRWRFGDGGSASGETVVHAYVRAGRYDVTVSQADAAGRTSTSATAVDVVAPARNLQRPTIGGTPRVGHTLTCSHGDWTGSPPIRYAYTWSRSGARIPGTTAPRYRLVRRDAGSVIRCEVVATNRAGSVRAASAGVSVEP